MAEDTITKADLAEALRNQLRTYAGIAFVTDPEKAAADIFDLVKRSREPEYEPGQFYQDATGRVFFRVLGDGKGWSLMPDGATYRHEYPQRPLRRLVPLPFREDLLAALEESIVREHGYEGQVNRVYDLLNGRGAA